MRHSLERMYSQEKGFYGRMELKGHQMLARMTGGRGTSACRRERGRSEKQRP